MQIDFQQLALVTNPLKLVQVEVEKDVIWISPWAKKTTLVQGKNLGGSSNYSQLPLTRTL